MRLPSNIEHRTSNPLLTCKQSSYRHFTVSAAIPSSGPRYRALLQLLRTAETLWNASRVFFEQWDLSPSQFNVLNLLYARPEGCTQIELSRSLIMHRSNVTGLVDRLEARGLLRRRDSANDRRAYRVRLTPAGRKRVRQILPRYYEAAEKVWDGLSVHRANRLVAELDRVCANTAKVTGNRSDS
jgi:DNA-binding MarR family transcriptional regulator